MTATRDQRSVHSPGLWSSRPLGRGILVSSAGHIPVAVVYGPGVNVSSAANTHLICAAPEMLMALHATAEWLRQAKADDEAGCDFLNEGGFDRMVDLQENVEQAIAAAEGRS
jgi:hypothetical protein